MIVCQKTRISIAQQKLDKHCMAFWAEGPKPSSARKHLGHKMYIKNVTVTLQRPVRSYHLHSTRGKWSPPEALQPSSRMSPIIHHSTLGPPLPMREDLRISSSHRQDFVPYILFSDSKPVVSLLVVLSGQEMEHGPYCNNAAGNSYVDDSHGRTGH